VSHQHSFYNRHQKQWRAGLEAFLGTLFLLIASVTLLRVETTPAPIYAGDEYAYLKHGLDLGKPSVAGPARDPGLQGLSNSVYFWIVRLAGRLTGDPTPSMRVVNFVCYFIGLPLLGGWLLLKRSGRTAVFLFIGLLAVLPSSVFVLSPMPEILFATIYTAIAVLTVLLLARAPTCTGLIAGAGLAMLAYIKPHALAAMAGFAVFFLVHSLKRWREREWPRRLLLLTFLAGIAIGIFCINATILGRLTFAPQFVGNIYAGPLQVAFSWSHFLQAAQTLIGFACLHTLILIMLFLLAFAGALQAVILINADLYRWGARHELDYASRPSSKTNANGQTTRLNKTNCARPIHLAIIIQFASLLIRSRFQSKRSQILSPIIKGREQAGATWKKMPAHLLTNSCEEASAPTAANSERREFPIVA
jgi:hypothetical protein